MPDKKNEEEADLPFDLGPDPNEVAVRNHRAGDVQRDARKLAGRMGYDYDRLDTVDRALLRRWVVMFPAQIRWYTAKRDELVAQQERQNWWLGILLFGTVLLMVAPGLIQLSNPDSKIPDLWASTAGVLISSMFGSWKMVMGMRDVRAQLKAFWQARTALTDRMYHFLAELPEGAPPKPDILDAGVHRCLEESLRDGRLIAEEERRAFFDALVAPPDALKLVQDNVTALGSGLEKLRTGVKDSQRERRESVEWIRQSRLELQMAIEALTLDRNLVGDARAVQEAELRRKIDWLDAIEAKIETGELEYIPASARRLPGD